MAKSMKKMHMTAGEDSKFHEPNAIKYEKEKEMPKDGKNSPWDFRCPHYDQRTSSFINAGTHYGTAMKQPVGHEGNPKQRAPCLPFGRIDTMRVDEEG